MRDHSECDAAYNEALARGKDGYAEYVMARCDLAHGQLTATQTASDDHPTASEEQPDER